MGTHINAIRAHLDTMSVPSTPSGEEQLVVQIRGNKFAPITATIIAEDSEENIGIRFWNMPKVPAERRGEVLEALNTINKSLRWCKFLIDNDEEIVAAIDAVVTAQTIGPIAHELLMRGAYVVDDASQTFLPALGLDVADYAPTSGVEVNVEGE